MREVRVPGWSGHRIRSRSARVCSCRVVASVGAARQALLTNAQRRTHGTRDMRGMETVRDGTWDAAASAVSMFPARAVDVTIVVSYDPR